MSKLFCYLRYPFFVVLGPLLIALFSTIGIIGSFFTRNPKWGTGITTYWARLMLPLTGMKLEVQGRENIPKEGVLFLFSHTSHFDIPVVAAGLGWKNFRFGAKSELYSVPFLGSAMKAFGTLPIHRSRREDVLKVYKESISRVKNGMSFALAPEGTRGDGVQLKSFKDGPFIFAVSGQIPIVPLVIVGNEKIMKKKSLLVGVNSWKQHVLLKILPAVETTGYNLDNRRELVTKVRDKMVVAYTEGQKHLGISYQ